MIKSIIFLIFIVFFIFACETKRITKKNIKTVEKESSPYLKEDDDEKLIIEN